MTENSTEQDKPADAAAAAEPAPAEKPKAPRKAAAEPAPAEKPKAPRKAAAKPAAESLVDRVAKVKNGKKGERTAHINRETTYMELAAEVNYIGSPRELAAANGIRNGRMELHPGDTVTIPAPYNPATA